MPSGACNWPAPSPSEPNASSGTVAAGTDAGTASPSITSAIAAAHDLVPAVIDIPAKVGRRSAVGNPGNLQTPIVERSLAETRRAGLEIALLGLARRALRREAVAGPGRRAVAGQLVQVRADGL